MKLMQSIRALLAGKVFSLAALRALALVGIVGFAASEAAAADILEPNDPTAGGSYDFVTQSYWVKQGTTTQKEPAAGDTLYIQGLSSGTVSYDLKGVSSVALKDIVVRSAADWQIKNGTLWLTADSSSRALWIQGNQKLTLDGVTLNFTGNSPRIYFDGTSTTTFKNGTTTSQTIDATFETQNASGASTVNFQDTANFVLGEVYSAAEANKDTRTLNFSNSCVAFANYRYQMTSYHSATTTDAADPLALNMTLGSNNGGTSGQPVLKVTGTLVIPTGSTLTIDANNMGAGTYQILSAGTLTNPGNLTCSLKNGNTTIIAAETDTTVSALNAASKTVTSGSLKYTLSSSDSKSVTLTITDVAPTPGGVNVETVTLVEGDEYYVRFTLPAGATASASTTWTVPEGVTSLRYLVVGGGGGGGTHRTDGTGSATGGGGGGGLLTGTLANVVGGTTYTITVGNGGAAGVNGGNSALGTIEALGGGHGAGYLPGSTSLSSASDGGSGGGGASTVEGGKWGAGTTGQGNAGAGGNSSSDGIGYTGGGGGGAGGVGTKGTSNTRQGGTGGAGVVSDITGVNIGYAGGGGGGGGNTGSTGSTYGSGGTATDGGGAGGKAASGGGDAGNAGTDGLGGGGGGNGFYASADGGRGGSGVVIIRYSYSVAVRSGDLDVRTVSLGNNEYFTRFTLPAGATTSGSTTWQVPNGVTEFEFLVVGGGGAGGGKGAACGGGGAGGMATGSVANAGGKSLAIQVGCGGSGVGTASGGQAGNGGNSSINAGATTYVLAYGGGGGANSSGTGAAGGSGGGTAGNMDSGTAGGVAQAAVFDQSVINSASYGNNGGTSGGSAHNNGGAGGGGADAAGGQGLNSPGKGIGGAGRASIITGTSTYYAGGGGGACNGSGSSVNAGGIGGGGSGANNSATGGQKATSGSPQTGGGGGGGNNSDGGNGGSGVVILRYTVANLPFEEATVTVAEPTVVRFTGVKFSPVVTVTLNGQNITDQCQFSWGGDMINAGLYTLTVRGKPGSEYDGRTLDAHPIFQILPLRSTDYGDWGYTYWYPDGEYRCYVTAYTNAPLSQTDNTYHPDKPYCLWQAPSGVTSVEIFAVGGAGGGSGGSSSQVGGGGSGGSVYRSETVSVTAGNFYEVLLGKGGAGGAANSAGGNGETTYLYAGTVTKTGKKADAGYEYEKWTRNPTTAMLSAAGGTGAAAASGTVGAKGTNAGSYDILVTDRDYGSGGAAGSGTAAGAAGADISGQGGTGGGTNAAGGKGGDGTLIIRYRVAEATRTAWKRNVQSGDWNTAENWEGNALPPYKKASGGAEFYMLDGATVVTVNSAANAQTLAVNNMAPLTLQINNKLTIGDRSSSDYAYENILIGCSAFPLPMTTLEFAGASSQLNVVPKVDNFGLQIGVGGSDDPTAKMSFKIPASGWATAAKAPLYDNAEESPITIGSSCVFEIDASAMTTTGSANKRCLCYAAGGVRVTAGLNYNYLSPNQWLASGRVQMTVPTGKRGVVVWLDESGDPIAPDTVDSAMGGIWFYLVDAVDIKDAVVTISKTTAGFTGSPVGEPEVTSVKLNGDDITSSCMLVGWKDENGKTVDGSQLTTWGTYTPIVQARPEQSYYGGTVDNATLPTFEILAAYYHKPGEAAWETVSGWFLDEALTDGVNVYPDNENVQVNVFAGGAANVVGKGGGSLASAKVKTVALRGNASDASKYAALADMTLSVKLEQSRSVVVAERGTSYLSAVDFDIASGSVDSAVAYADVLAGATLGIDNVSIGTRLIAQMEAGSTLKFLTKGLAGSGTGSVLHGLQGIGSGVRTVIVENNTVQFQNAVGVEGALDLQLTPGANNTTANTMLTIDGAFTVGSGSTLTVDAGQKGPGTYTLMTAASGNALGILAANATVTYLQPGFKAKFVTTETAGVVTKVDLKIERGLIISFSPAAAQ